MRAALLVALLVLAGLVLVAASPTRMVPPHAVLLCVAEIDADGTPAVECWSPARFVMKLAKISTPHGERDVFWVAVDAEDAEKIARETREKLKIEGT